MIGGRPLPNSTLAILLSITNFLTFPGYAPQAQSG
jgi:hypothetical protein